MNLKMCESDYKFMSIIWNNEPVRSGRLVELCAEKLNWKKSTTYTTLKKYVKKDMQKIKTALFRQQLKKARCRSLKAGTLSTKHFQAHSPIF